MSGRTSARVGMVGAGQLARMTQRAAIDLGVALTVLTERDDDPAVTAGATVERGPADDPAALDRLADRVDVVTFDHELVDGAAVARLEARGVAVRPSASALAHAQDKLLAREAFARAGLPGPAHAVATDEAAVAALAGTDGWPLVAKARRGGYDGRGVAVVADAEELAGVLARGGEWIVEQRVPIAVELAVVLARRPGGDLVTYPVVETVQRDGICHELVMPARVPSETAARAVEVATAVAEAVDAVGICAVELFVTPDGAVLVNEIALRPHNSGHATIEGALTSQFHNHLRAVLDWPLGATGLRAPVAATVNVLGADDPAVADRVPAALAVPGAHLHLYGKAARPGRKVGHVTVLGDDAGAALTAARRAARALTHPPTP